MTFEELIEEARKLSPGERLEFANLEGAGAHAAYNASYELNKDNKKGDPSYQVHLLQGKMVIECY